MIKYNLFVSLFLLASLTVDIHQFVVAVLHEITWSPSSPQTSLSGHVSSGPQKPPIPHSSPRLGYPLSQKNQKQGLMNFY